MQSPPGTMIYRFDTKEYDANDVLHISNVIIDVTGNFIAGLLLTYLLRSKFDIFRDNRYWLARRRQDWWDECRIKPKQFDRAIKRLENLGLVEVRTWKFGDAPTKHISLNIAELKKRIKEVL